MKSTATKSTFTAARLVASIVGMLMLFSAPCSFAAVDDDSNENPSSSQQSIMSEPDTSRQPRVVGGRFVLPEMIAPSLETTNIGNGRTPEGYLGGEPSRTELLPESPQDRGETWNWTVGHWAAADTFSHPRYFEDRMLERHGHERHPHLQPFVSGARFFATVPMLPYLMTVRDPFDCESTLGYYRSGSCAPVMLQRPPYERRAAIGEAAAIAGAIIALP